MESNLFIEPEIKQYLTEENLKTEFESRFAFLKEHFGLRPRSIHLFLGVAGAGKSTLTRAILKDTIEAEQGPVLLWLTEEEVEDFVLNYDDSPSDENMKKIIVYSEINEKQEYATKYFWLWLDDMLATRRPCALFIDNITTSTHYAEKTPQEQLEFVRQLKKTARAHNIPIAIMAHTKDGINDNMNRLIEVNDVRGTKSIINLVEYLYIMQRFQIGETFYPTIRIKKHRRHRVNNTLYRFFYSHTKNTYTHDKAILFDEFKEAFQSRNSLEWTRKKKENRPLEEFGAWSKRDQRDSTILGLDIENSIS